MPCTRPRREKLFGPARTASPGIHAYLNDRSLTKSFLLLCDEHHGPIGNRFVEVEYIPRHGGRAKAKVEIFCEPCFEQRRPVLELHQGREPVPPNPKWGKYTWRADLFRGDAKPVLADADEGEDR